MIEINLLPEELKKSQPRFKKFDISGIDFKNVPVTNIAAAVVGFIVAIHVLLFLVGITSQGRLSVLSKRYNQLLPQKKESEALKAQVDAINKKVGAIDELMVKRFSWARKLNDLSDSMTPGIWLTELSYDEKVGERPVQANAKAPAGRAKKETPKATVEKVVLKYLIISGYASSMGEQGTALIGKFIKSMQDNSNFYSDINSVDLVSTKSDKVDNQDVMSFRITCLFK